MATHDSLHFVGFEEDRYAACYLIYHQDRLLNYENTNFIIRSFSVDLKKLIGFVANEGEKSVQLVLGETLDGFLRVSVTDSEAGDVFYLKTKEVREPPALMSDPANPLVLMPANSFCAASEKMGLGGDITTIRILPITSNLEFMSDGNSRQRIKKVFASNGDSAVQVIPDGVSTHANIITSCLRKYAKALAEYCRNEEADMAIEMTIDMANNPLKIEISIRGLSVTTLFTQPLPSEDVHCYGEMGDDQWDDQLRTRFIRVHATASSTPQPQEGEKTPLLEGESDDDRNSGMSAYEKAQQENEKPDENNNIEYEPSEKNNSAGCSPGKKTDENSRETRRDKKRPRRESDENA
ncbi:Oidioi.mRNA.OKI2018_I69.chr1.g3559.t1.cds [Oikopleura dioica]|uniref:Oidioi.mRNA.OKI2018_I69.chr1.g3559.t1.cds n=1 Tax=Oikopleura dioica TaxID=34765 RepID=A0ABN7SUI7_OIKDI|nr:Oidioi.mRNA.OKI2018_I69.chr1.g3559.t1.cds [Oikopleura dioica]